MFSKDSHCTYQKNQITEVICQLRFPEILAIGANLPVEFQEAIREEFPRYSSRQETPAPKISGTPGHLQLENLPPVTNYQFVSADGAWRVNLTNSFISLACCRYTCWEAFAAKLDKPLAAFIKLYKPAWFDRVGLRYVNAISRKSLDLEGTPFRELINDCWLGILSDDDIQESAAARSTVDAEFGIRGGCRAKVHAGPGLLKRNGKQDPEVKFIFDLDLFMPGKLELNLAAGALQTLHAQSWSMFRGAITETLHEAML